LPTSEEREYAAKGGQSRIFPWGDEPWTVERANIAGQNDGYETTSPVGRFPTGASLHGLLDLVGDVWEWTASDLDGGKELRGGGHLVHPKNARNSYRYKQASTNWNPNYGFRCAHTGQGVESWPLASKP
jgi:iron(II)-dependent oxidoreductase